MALLRAVPATAGAVHPDCGDTGIAGGLDVINRMVANVHYLMRTDLGQRHQVVENARVRLGKAGAIGVYVVIKMVC